MPQMFQPPHAYIPDPNGKPYAGAKAYFYITGTTTAQNTYSDYALTVPNANPVVADGNGMWGPIYLLPNVRYRVTLKTSTDALIYTQDDYAGTQGTNTFTSQTYVATLGQTVFTVSASYTPGSATCSVYLNGAKLISGLDYTETSSTVITLITGAGLGDNVEIITGSPVNDNASSSALVTFLQAGTGAVARTVQSKERDTVSVKDFGAVGDGTTDDTAAMQAAHTAAAGRPVFYPKGTYLFTTLTLALSGDGIVGEGSGDINGNGNTKLVTATTGSAITLTTSTAHNVILKDFTLKQSGSVQGKGVVGTDVYWLRTDNLRVIGFVDNLYFSKAIYHHHKRLFSETSTNGVNYYGSAGVWNTAWFNNVLTFDTCRFTGCTVTGIAVKGCEVVFINPDFTGMTTAAAIGCKIYGESASYPAHGISIIAPYVESTQVPFSFSYALAQIDAGGFIQGGATVGAQYTSIIDADNSTIYWNGAIKDQDYWANGYRLTNTTTLTFRKSFSGSVRASVGSVDATSKVQTDDYDEGIFTATLTGCTTSPTGTVSYVRKGKMVTLSIPSISGTSNTTAASLTGVPASLTPANGQSGISLIFDNGVSLNGNFSVTNVNVINLYKGPYGTVFLNSGTKGVQACAISYSLF